MVLAASEMLTLSVWFAEGDGSVCRCIADVFCAAQAAETSFRRWTIMSLPQCSAMPINSQYSLRLSSAYGTRGIIEQMGSGLRLLSLGKRGQPLPFR